MMSQETIDMNVFLKLLLPRKKKIIVIGRESTRGRYADKKGRSFSHINVSSDGNIWTEDK